MSICYIYVYEIDGVVRYIGRGRGRRILHHLAAVQKRSLSRASGAALRPHRFYDRLENAIQSNAKIVGRMIHVGLTGDQAAAMEMQEIRKYPPEELWNTITASTPRICDAEWRARQSAGAKLIMADPDRRRAVSAKLKSYNDDPVLRQRKAEETRKRWADPAHREMRIQAQRRAFAEPAEKARKRDATTKSWTDPQTRAKRAAGLSAALAGPDYRAKLSVLQRERLSGFPAIGRAWWAAESRLDLLRCLREAGITYPQIAERLGTSVSRVATMARRLGIKPTVA